AVDAAGVQRTASGSVSVVSANADGSVAETGQSADFPAVFIDAPLQALPNQVVDVDAIAPAARVDLDVPSPAGPRAAALLLVRRATFAGDIKLSVIDRLSAADRAGTPVLRTGGREFPGMSSTGDYAVVAAAVPLVFLRGRLTGPPAIVTV